jgi:hypothetical protein
MFSHEISVEEIFAEVFSKEEVCLESTFQGFLLTFLFSLEKSLIRSGSGLQKASEELLIHKNTRKVIY